MSRRWKVYLVNIAPVVLVGLVANYFINVSTNPFGWIGLMLTGLFLGHIVYSFCKGAYDGFKYGRPAETEVLLGQPTVKEEVNGSMWLVTDLATGDGREGLPIEVPTNVKQWAEEMNTTLDNAHAKYQSPGIVIGMLEDKENPGHFHYTYTMSRMMHPLDFVAMVNAFNHQVNTLMQQAMEDDNER